MILCHTAKMLRLGFNKLKTEFLQNARLIATSTPCQLKEIRETQEGKNLIIEGCYTSSPREPYLVKQKDPSKCSLCELGLDLKHTDVLILSQFLRSDGCMLPKRVTGLCGKQQRKVSTLVTMAQKAGLMPNINPSYSNKDPKKRYKWKKCNTYFDESTIKPPRFILLKQK